MRSRKIMAGITALSVAATQLFGVMPVLSGTAFAQEERIATKEEITYFNLLCNVSSITGKVTINELSPEGKGFASFFMQNLGGNVDYSDWYWYACYEDDLDTTDVNEGENAVITSEPGLTYDFAWTCVQDTIVDENGKLLITAPYDYTTGVWSGMDLPICGVEVVSYEIKAEGDKGRVDAVVSDVVITLTNGRQINIPDYAVVDDLLGHDEGWGISGHNAIYNMKDDIIEYLSKNEIPEIQPNESEGIYKPVIIEATEPVPGDTDKPSESEDPTEPDKPVEVTNYDKTESANTEVIPEGAELVLSQTKPDEAAAADAQSAISAAIAKATEKALSDVSITIDAVINAELIKDGANVQPDGDMLIFIDKGTSNLVAYIGEDSVEFFAIESDSEGNSYIKTPHLSTFYLITVDEGDKDTLLTAGKVDMTDDSDTSSADEPTSDESTSGNDNPPTGAGLAVVPAMLAAAALTVSGVVLRKRSK